MDTEYPLQTLFTHLYGELGVTAARLTDGQPGERVAVLGPGEPPPRFLTQPLAAREQEEDEPRDPLPAVEFVTPNELTVLQECEAVVGMLPTGGPTAKDAVRLLSDLSESSLPTRGVFFLPAGLLSHSRDELRAAFLNAGSVEEIVFGDARSAQQMPSTNITWALVHVLFGGRTTRARLSSSHGEYADGYTSKLTAETPWTLTGLDPELKTRIERWAEQTKAQPLDAITRDDLKQRPSTDDTPVLAARAVTRDGLDLTEVLEGEKATDRGPTQVLHAGDVVGRTLGNDPQWCVVPDEAHGYRVIRNQVHVLAPSEIAPEMLVTFLNSEMAELQVMRSTQGAVIPRISKSALSDLLVPDLAGLAGLDPVGGLQELRAASSELLQSLTDQVEGSFDLGQADLRHALVTAERDARLAAEMIQQVREDEYRAQQTFPHPLARAVRQLRTKRDAGDVRGSYDELLRIGETSTIFLGLVMGSLLRREEFDCEELDTWQRAAGKGGASLGHWLGLVRRGAEAARRSDNPLGGLASTLRTNGPLLNALERLVQQRNDDSHGSAPRTPAEYQTRVDTLRPTLGDLLTELSALSHCQFFIVDSMEYATTSGFRMMGRDLRGDHPDFMPWSRVSTEALDTGVVHVDFSDDQPPLSLRGYCSLIACSQCLREELCYPDKISGDEVKMRSLERGHLKNAVDAEMAGYLRGQ